MRTRKILTAAAAHTKLPSVHTEALPEPASCLDSRFGGIFYLPQGETVPACPEGEEMQFLAQINFAQMPELKGFPRKGILQFFLDTDLDRFESKIHGESLKRELYTIRYYPEPQEALQQNIIEQQFVLSQTITEVIQNGERISWEEYLQKQQEKVQNQKPPVSIIMSMMRGEPLPSPDQMPPVIPPPKFESRRTRGHMNLPWLKGKMSFHRTREIATLSLGMELSSDFGYETVWKRIRPFMIRASGYDIEGWESDTDDFYWDFGNWGCKIGGHPALRQADIRSEFDEYKSYTALLFQYDLTTRERLGLGTFDFFIRPEDLAACRFDRVLFHWHS